MRIHHTLVIRVDVGVPLLERCGVPYTGKGKSRFWTVDITEDDARWPAVAAAMEQYRQSLGSAVSVVLSSSSNDRVWTEFNDVEREHAAYLEVSPSWIAGHPQPEGFLAEKHGIDRWPYLRNTFQYKRCEECMDGKEQIAPFRIKALPSWKTRAAFGLHGEPDEIFVRFDAYVSVFKDFGIGWRQVMYSKASSAAQGDASDDVVQLDVTRTADLETMGLSTQETCGRCGRRSYRWECVGGAPRPINADMPMFRCNQGFQYLCQSIVCAE